MITKIIKAPIVLLLLLFVFSNCQKEKYKFGEIIAPSGLSLTTVVAGVDASNPNGNGTGSITVNTKATDALTYKIDFGDGKNQIVPSGVVTYKYTNPGTNDYIITVSAIGTGGAISTLSKKVKVFVAFEIPAYIVTALTNGSSKVWVIDKDVPAHFGVGQSDLFNPNWWAISPNDAVKAPAYDDEITFSKDALNNISLKVDNKGQTFIIGAATSFYGFSGADAGYPLVTGDTKKLSFMNATSTSTSSVSTRIQFVVPGNGIISFGTGGVTYEILSISATNMNLRNIGIDGNAWYQKLKSK